MMEGISYIAGTEVPVVLVDVVRGGPGLGNIAPSQGDYNQIVHGGGHGDFHPIVLAPSSVQEAVDLTVLAFDLAEKYRTIVIVLADGNIGQMMEPAEMPPMRPIDKARPEWAVTGAKDREQRILSSIYIQPEDQEVVDLRLMQTWETIKANEIRYKEYYLEDAEFIVMGFGTAGRVALSAVREARQEGIRVGLFRPVTVNPYPFDRVSELVDRAKAFLVVEMNAGQMYEDVRSAVRDRIPVEFYGRMGGIVPFPDEVLGEIRRIAHEGIPEGDPRQRWLNRLEKIIKEESG
jgi:2-oxoglutarate ferredoxin oxidoreductase subunit alpha